ncbi:ribonuclease HI [[Phormidium ambiguum] IAM M-71]|uniref:Ribonuclease H n=1 Tax=[Phormidium ambiguum] IAM M-71 TaxID=454136 RepID=A0A1U7IG66_9CYAN|nr:ribonuclease HI [Phormidium ambiguum]OKH36061.1 ribonuclease HI [Phormidium ambiguum IAM M-71]
MSTFPQIKSIYTDGACSGNPGPGGWGVVIYFADGSVSEMGGAEAQTTNNRMELQAAIAALEFLSKTGQQEPIILYTDSEYVKKGITQWVKGWKNKGWKTAQGKAVLNQDLWETLDRLNTTKINWEYVRGHAGNVGNERCDEIARNFSLSRPQTLKQLPRLESLETFSSETTVQSGYITLQSSDVPSDLSTFKLTMTDATISSAAETLESLSGEGRITQLRNLVEVLHIADDIATKGYLITSSELADLMDIHTSAVTSRGDNWVWRNWVVSRVRREGNQILWQLERVD